MTLDDVRALVQAISERAFDNEAAHSMADDLYIEVLRAVANGHPDAGAMAAHALLVEDIDFERWCA